MNILITGGAGFLGSHLLSAMDCTSDNIFCFDDLSVGHPDFIPSGVTFIKGKIESVEDVKKAVKISMPDIVVHLAAIHHIPTCEKYISRACEVNVVGTNNLCETLLQCGFSGLLIFASTGGVYSPENSFVLDESASVATLGVYPTTKIWCEEILLRTSKTCRFKICNLRLFNMVGSNETNAHLVPDILKQLRLDPNRIYHGNLSPRRDFIHVKDVSFLIRTIITSSNNLTDTFSTFNVCSGVEISVKNLIDMCQIAAGTSATLIEDERKVRKVDRSSQLGSNKKIISTFPWTPKFSVQSAIIELWDQIMNDKVYFE